jgi:hypothetical protein
MSKIKKNTNLEFGTIRRISFTAIFLVGEISAALKNEFTF